MVKNHLPMPDNLKDWGDEQLLDWVACGNEPAFRELYQRYQAPLIAKAIGLVGCENTAKDCLQDVFVYIWVKRESLEIRNLNNYLHQAVRYRALRFLYKRIAAVRLDRRAVVFDRVMPPGDQLEFKELSMYFENLIGLLPPDQRKIFRMNREESLTYSEIAQRLEISVKTVEKKMSLSLRFLRGHSLQ